MAAAPVYALDFDGVLCDSVVETSISGVVAAAEQWGGEALTAAAAGARTGGIPGWLAAALRTARPVVETGFEVVLMARALCQAGAAGAPQLADAFLVRWPALRDLYLAEWGRTREDLIAAFGAVRDRWIADDLDSWLAVNHFFPGVADAINFAAGPVYVITTKQARFCELLLRRNGVGPEKIPSERIFAQGSGTKVSTLKKLLAVPGHAARTISFVEDRYETLEGASLSLLGQPIDLFLASWGYNTERTREECADHPLIGLIDLPTFVSKLQ